MSLSCAVKLKRLRCSFSYFVLDLNIASKVLRTFQRTIRGVGFRLLQEKVYCCFICSFVHTLKVIQADQMPSSDEKVHNASHLMRGTVWQTLKDVICRCLISWCSHWTNDSLREIHNPIITVRYIWCIFLSWSGITSFFNFHNGSGTKRKRNTLVEFLKLHIWIFVGWMKYVITTFILLLSMSPFHKTYTWSFHSFGKKQPAKVLATNDLAWWVHLWYL